MLFPTLAIVAVIVAVVVYQVVKLRRAVGQNSASQAPKHTEMLVELSFDNELITAKYPDGNSVTLKWSELTNIGMGSIDPVGDSPSLYWGLHAGKQIPTISYPHGAIGDKELMAEFVKRLPGFNLEKVMQAVATTGRAHFQIWPKK
jgi:hypothetical protein